MTRVNARKCTIAGTNESDMDHLQTGQQIDDHIDHLDPGMNGHQPADAVDQQVVPEQAPDAVAAGT